MRIRFLQGCRLMILILVSVLCRLMCWGVGGWTARQLGRMFQVNLWKYLSSGPTVKASRRKLKVEVERGIGSVHQEGLEGGSAEDKKVISTRNILEGCLIWKATKLALWFSLGSKNCLASAYRSRSPFKLKRWWGWSKTPGTAPANHTLRTTNTSNRLRTASFVRRKTLWMMMCRLTSLEKASLASQHNLRQQVALAFQIRSSGVGCWFS